MLTRPDGVTDVALAGTLAAGWAIEVDELEYLAVGFGSHHWRATTSSTSWFVTVDDLVAKRSSPGESPRRAHERLDAALRTARALADAGLEFVVAPVPTAGADVTLRLDDRFAIAVYPLVRGRSYDYGNYTDAAHRDAVVDHLAALHRSPESCRRTARTETFSIARRVELFTACSQLTDPWEFGPYAEPARHLLARHADAVVAAFATYDTLAAAARSRSERFVVTHGEPHPANTISTDDGVVLIDWDTALIAPPERDLWELVDEERSVAARYESLIGDRVDDDAIDLYRLAWDLTEIAIYVSDFRRPHHQTADTEQAWSNLQHFLDPTRW